MTALAASYFKDVLGNVIDAIEGGSTLSQALELHPELFDRVFISLIRVGEESGRLGHAYSSRSPSRSSGRMNSPPTPKRS